MRRFGMETTVQLRNGAMTIPNWITGKSIVFFFVAMFACFGLFGYVPSFDLVLVSCISVILFFYGSSSMAKGWAKAGDKHFIRNIFIAGVVIRILWILYLYYNFNPAYYGNTYGNQADTDWYMDFGKDLALWFSGESTMSLSQIIDFNQAVIDDTGYSFWLGIVYFISGGVSDVMIPMIVKAMLSAYCSICIYHIAIRHFGSGAARVAAVLMCVNPNMIYWCGTMMKESEMVFLCCFAIDNFDRVLSSGQRYTFKNLLPGILAGLALMFFRTSLGLVMFLAVFTHIVMASQRVMSMGRKVLAGLLVATVLLVSMGDRIRMQSRQLVQTVQSDAQSKNMEWRANRKQGNSFARYASAAVFAPLIFTLPFPTFNSPYEGQYTQIQLSGGSYIKNILSFFVLIVLFMMLISGEWRRHVFILAYTVGYHLVLVMSNFAHSGRFHMPVWPMIILFAAYGIQIAKTNPRVRKWFPIVLVLEVVVCVAWNWFKLKGRGMI